MTTEHIPAEEVQVGRKITTGGKTYWMKDPDEPIWEPWDWEPKPDFQAQNKLQVLAEQRLLFATNSPERSIISGC